jgi:hypothetical protein
VSVTPERQVALGYCVDLRWDVQGDVSNVRITANGASLRSNAPLRGFVQHCPTATGMVRYVVEATGPGGTSRSEHDVEVIRSTTPLPTSTPLPPSPGAGPPDIRFFDVQPTQVGRGQCVTVGWELAGNVQSFRLTRNGAVIQDGGPFIGRAHDCLGGAGQYTYRMDAWNSGGEHVYDEQVVVVR